MKNIVLILVSGFLGVSCQTVESPTFPEGEGRVKGFVHGLITNASDSSPLASVKVTYVISDSVKSVTSDASGFYSIPNLAEGSYDLVYELTDYATMSAEINISDPSGNFDELDDEDYRVSILKSVQMYKKDASVIGAIYAFRDEENTVPAQGATVVLDVDVSSNRGILGHIFSAETDSAGSFVFDQLPAVPSATWMILPFIDDPYTYAVATGSISLLVGGESSVGDVVLAIAPPIPLVLQNNFEADDFPVEGNLSITFSKAIDPTTMEVSLSRPFGTVSTELSWDSNNIVLTIDPIVTLGVETTYSLSIQARSADGNVFTYFFSFSTELGIQVVSTDLLSVDGLQVTDFAISDNPTVTFSRPADTASSIVFLEKDATGLEVASTVSWSADNLTVTVNPLHDLEPGISYELRLSPVISTVAGDELFQDFVFSTLEELQVPENVSGFSLDLSVLGDDFHVDWNTTLLSFIWDAASNAEGYIIFARDNKSNTDLIEVSQFSAQDFVTKVQQTVTLPAQFDLYFDDAFQSPFSGGTQVSFRVAGVNAAGTGELSTELTLSDVLGARATNIIQVGSARNADTTQSSNFTLRVSFNEYGDVSDTPGLFFTEVGGDTAFVFSSSDATWEWDPDPRSGVYTVTIPLGADGRFDIVSIHRVRDNSGNVGTETTSVTLFF